jgi:hypothetical protein
MVLEYRTIGLVELAAKYGSHHVTVKRWLIEQGVAIRKRGLVGRGRGLT